MLNRYAVLLVAGAAIFALDASVASAQDTTRARPRSTKRIPITKEVAGRSRPRASTRSPCTRPTRCVFKGASTRSTSRRPKRSRESTRCCSRQFPQILRQIGGFYIGLAAGSSLPAANFNDSDKPGWRIEVPIGVDPINFPLGVRFNFGYSSYSPHSYAERFVDNAALMNFDGDLKWRLVKIQPYNKRVQVYGIAGASYNRFKNVIENDRWTA